MSSTSKLGLRDRKRVETRARIEDAALTLVLRDGVDAATVDAISELADISPRTFFNYFESKDSAVLGVPPAEVTDQMIAGYLADHRTEPLVPSIVGLLLTVMGSPQSLRAGRKSDRLEVVKRHPEILSSQMAQLGARAGRLTETVEDMLTRRSPDVADPSVLAQLLLASCAAAVRVAVREWAENLDGTGADANGADMNLRAIALVNQLRERLS